MESERGDQGGLPEVCGGGAERVRAGEFRVGVLDAEVCAGALELTVDDQQWLHQHNLFFIGYSFRYIENVIQNKISK